LNAFQRIKRPETEPAAKLPDEAVAYLFGPLVEAIRKEASDAVAAAAATSTNTS